jgi:hypothetical protein
LWAMIPSVSRPCRISRTSNAVAEVSPAMS